MFSKHVKQIRYGDQPCGAESCTTTCDGDIHIALTGLSPGSST